MTIIIRWFNNPYVLRCLLWAVIAAFLTSWGFVADLNKSEWASWVQGVGTIGAIGGAFLVANWQVTQQRRHAAALVRQMFSPIAYALDQLAFMYGAPSRAHQGETDDEPVIFTAAKWLDVSNQAQRVIETHKKFDTRKNRYEAGLNLLSASSLAAAMALENELEDAIRGVVRDLQFVPSVYDPSESSANPNDCPPSWRQRVALMASNRKVHAHMAQLKRDSS